jgi:ankyrin repeat protein
LECVLSLLHGGYVVDSWKNLLMVARAYENEAVMALVAGHIPVDILETMTHYPTTREFQLVRYFHNSFSETEMIRDFISDGGVVNTNAVREDSLLHIAFKNLEPTEELFDILFVAGADILKPDSVGNTPLHIAANSKTGIYQILRRAQAQGVDLKEFVNRRNDMDETALDYLLRARRRYFNPSCQYNVWEYFIRSFTLRDNAELLMAFGATVSRRNVIRFKHLIPSDEMFRIARTHFTIKDSSLSNYQDTLDLAQWVHMIQQPLLSSRLPLELADMIQRISIQDIQEIHNRMFEAILTRFNEDPEE